LGTSVPGQLQPVTSSKIHAGNDWSGGAADGSRPFAPFESGPLQIADATSRAKFADICRNDARDGADSRFQCDLPSRARQVVAKSDGLSRRWTSRFDGYRLFVPNCGAALHLAATAGETP